MVHVFLLSFQLVSITWLCRLWKQPLHCGMVGENRRLLGERPATLMHTVYKGTSGLFVF
jgi:hypothetical protein